QASETRLGQISAGISKPLASGGTIGAEIDYTRTSLGFVSPLASQLASVNPAYNNEINLSYRHPLLRGAGRPDYNEALTAAQSDILAAGLQQQIVAQGLSLQALDLHFRLASNDISVTLAEQAVGRARRLLNYQHMRERFGLIETADRLQAEALLAARKMELEQSRALRATNQAALNRLMLRAPNTPLAVTLDADHQDIQSPDFAAAVESARINRPELKALDAQLQAAESRLLLARDSERTQLDVVAELGTRSLDGSAGIALKKGFGINDRFAALSLELSDAVGDNGAKSAIRKAELTRQRVLAEKTRMLELIKDDLSAAITTITTGRATLASARKREAAEKLKFEAEVKRYREGRSDTATIVQFEGDLRIAALQAELQRISLLQAERQLAWSQGTLLQQLGITYSDNVSKK
ncbi:MAG: TolC family protein, partial [Mariprofundaceae bacterium]